MTVRPIVSTGTAWRRRFARSGLVRPVSPLADSVAAEMPLSSGLCSCCSRPSLVFCGANMHTSIGVSNQRQLLPIDGAAAVGLLHLVGFFRENGCTMAHVTAARRRLQVLAQSGHVARSPCRQGMSSYMLSVLEAPTLCWRKLPAEVRFVLKISLSWILSICAWSAATGTPARPLPRP